MNKLRSPFKIHGGKSYLSSWIIENFPQNYENMNYIEPFCGGASILLNKNISKEEIINDLDLSVVNLFRVLRDQEKEFLEKIKKVQYKKEVFEEALTKKEFDNDIDYAINEFILRRMSRGGIKKSFAWSERLRGNKPGEVNAWNTIIELIPTISERIKNLYIFNKPAVDILKTFDTENTLCYCDPPYLPETREAPDVYSIEMNLDQHIDLAEILNCYKGKILLSGYPSRLYNRLYKNWKCVSKKIVNHSSQQKVKPIKTELLWINF